MNVLVDANVLVSGLQSRYRLDGAIAEILALATSGRIEMWVAEESQTEVRSTFFTTPWFLARFSSDVTETSIAEIRSVSLRLPALAYAPPRRCRDRSDDYLLEQAIRFGADVLLTGDDDLLSIENPPVGLRIIEARAFVDDPPVQS